MDRVERLGPSQRRSVYRVYRFHAPLLAALLRHVDAHPGATFRRHAEELRADGFAGISRLLLSRRDEMAHADPERAVEFPRKPISWPDLNNELQRFALGYFVPSTAIRR